MSYDTQPGQSTNVPLTAAQRLAVAEADFETGRVGAATSTLRRLAELGMVRPYGRLGAYYLTERGRSFRQDLLCGRSPRPEAERQPLTGFVPATGDEQGADAADRPRPQAARDWEGLLEIRRLTQPFDHMDGAVPAAWERTRPVHAVALALEATGLVPSAVDGSGRRVRTGYRVTSGAEQGNARVEWRLGAEKNGQSLGYDDDARERLTHCARLLGARGWESERYLDTRRRPFLTVAPSPHR